jgi:hypothetical protein
VEKLPSDRDNLISLLKNHSCPKEAIEMVANQLLSDLNRGLYKTPISVGAFEDSAEIIPCPFCGGIGVLPTITYINPGEEPTKKQV